MLSATGLKINVADGVFNVSNAAGQSLVIPATEMSCFYFSQSGASLPQLAATDNIEMEVYTIEGYLPGGLLPAAKPWHRSTQAFISYLSPR